MKTVCLVNCEQSVNAVVVLLILAVVVLVIQYVRVGFDHRKLLTSTTRGAGAISWGVLPALVLGKHFFGLDIRVDMTGGVLVIVTLLSLLWFMEHSSQSSKS